MKLTYMLQAVNPAEELGSVTGQTLDVVRVVFILCAVLLLAYVAVLKYMADKPEDVLATEAAQRAAAPPGSVEPCPSAHVPSRRLDGTCRAAL